MQLFAFHVRPFRTVAVHGNTEIVHPVYPDSTRLEVSQGAAVFVRATEGDLQIRASTRPWQHFANGIGCRREGGTDVCTEAFEHCDASGSVWRAAVRKTTDAPARVRIEFVFR
jgi:hypothetical protein